MQNRGDQSSTVALDAVALDSELYLRDLVFGRASRGLDQVSKFREGSKHAEPKLHKRKPQEIQIQSKQPSCKNAWTHNQNFPKDTHKQPKSAQNTTQRLPKQNLKCSLLSLRAPWRHPWINKVFSPSILIPFVIISAFPIIPQHSPAFPSFP